MIWPDKRIFYQFKMLMIIAKTAFKKKLQNFTHSTLWVK